MPLARLGASVETAEAVEIQMKRELAELSHIEALWPDAVTDALHKADLPVWCRGQLLCLAQAGKTLQTDLVLEVTVASLGKAASVAIRLVQSSNASQLGYIAESLPQDPTKLARKFRSFAIRLFQPQAYVGSLSLDISQDGADIFLDDASVGKSPLESPIHGLEPGKHVLRVSKAGFLDFNAFVTVEFNELRRVKIDLADNSYKELLVEKPLRQTGEFYVVAPRAGLEIRIDGEPIGFTHQKEAVAGLAAGEHRLSLYQKAQRLINVPVTIKEEQRTLVPVKEIAPDQFEVMPLQFTGKDAALPDDSAIAAMQYGAPADGGAASRAAADSGVDLTAAQQPFLPRWVTWSLFGGAGASLAGGAAFAAIAWKRFGLAEQQVANSSEYEYAEHREVVDAYERSKIVSIVLTGVSCAAAAGGLLLYFNQSGQADAFGGHTTILPIAYRHGGGGALISHRF